MDETATRPKLTSHKKGKLLTSHIVSEGGSGGCIVVNLPQLVILTRFAFVLVDILLSYRRCATCIVNNRLLLPLAGVYFNSSATNR